jgi:hypothetical protein
MISLWVAGCLAPNRKRRTKKERDLVGPVHRHRQVPLEVTRQAAPIGATAVLLRGRLNLAVLWTALQLLTGRKSSCLLAVVQIICGNSRCRVR